MKEGARIVESSQVKCLLFQEIQNTKDEICILSIGSRCILLLYAWRISSHKSNKNGWRRSGKKKNKTKNSDDRSHRKGFSEDERFLQASA